jgi:hypothetical protein
MEINRLITGHFYWLKKYIAKPSSHTNSLDPKITNTLEKFFSPKWCSMLDAI